MGGEVEGYSTDMAHGKPQIPPHQNACNVATFRGSTLQAANLVEQKNRKAEVLQGVHMDFPEHDYA